VFPGGRVSESGIILSFRFHHDRLSILKTETNGEKMETSSTKERKKKIIKKVRELE